MLETATEALLGETKREGFEPLATLGQGGPLRDKTLDLPAFLFVHHHSMRALPGHGWTDKVRGEST
jgi:hypothetical protein